MKFTNPLSFLLSLLLLLVHLSLKPIIASKNVHYPFIPYNNSFILHSILINIYCFMWFQPSSYVVYFGAHSHVGEITEDAMDRVRETHYDFLGSFTGRSRFLTHLNDLICYHFHCLTSLYYVETAVRLPQTPFSTHTQSTSMALQLISTMTSHLQSPVSIILHHILFICLWFLGVDSVSIFLIILQEHPEVVSVFPNKALKLHTTRSWDFLGLEHNSFIPSSSIWRKARFGEDTIIANLDTGSLSSLFPFLPFFCFIFLKSFGQPLQLREPWDGSWGRYVPTFYKFSK